jgi:hypothetical protein
VNRADLVELKYLSKTVSDINVWGLSEVVNISTKLNSQHGITGILFFDRGYFGQILEGRRDAVESTWGKIKNDPRHHEIELLSINNIEQRQFPKWSMKFLDVEQFASTFPQFSEALSKMEDPTLETFKALKALWQQV